MYVLEEYPEWQDICGDVDRDDLEEIVNRCLYGDEDIEVVVRDYIEANYEPVIIEDIDRAYEDYKEELIDG
jgi:hypothetical protein